jgi:hypothetical protein
MVVGKLAGDEPSHRGIIPYSQESPRFFKDQSGKVGFPERYSFLEGRKIELFEQVV